VRVACHQPNFLPWLGFFAKMYHAAVFVLLDDVQFTQGHGKHNWTTRVRVRGPNGPLWLTVPVHRAGAGKQPIGSVRIDEADARWLPKLLRTLEQVYGRSRYFEHCFPSIATALRAPEPLLCALNVRLIHAIRGLLGVETTIRMSSDFDVAATGTERLIELTRLNGGDVYLSGDGAESYQVEPLFRARGVKLERLGFVHPAYPQAAKGEFVPGLSVIDALFSIGPEGTRETLASARGAMQEIQGA
jgi:hypothetical protein